MVFLSNFCYICKSLQWPPHPSHPREPWGTWTASFHLYDLMTWHHLQPQRDFHGLWVLKGMVCVGSKMLVFWFKKTVGDTFVLFEKDVRCLWQFCKDLLFSNTWLLWNSVDKRMDKDVQTLDLSTWRTWQKENWVLKLEKVVALDALFGNLGVAGGKLCLYINTDFPALQGVRLLWIFLACCCLTWNLNGSSRHQKPSDAPNTWMAQSPKTKPPATSKKAGEHFTKKKNACFPPFFSFEKKRKIYSYMCTWSRNSTSIFWRVFRNPPLNLGLFQQQKPRGKPHMMGSKHSAVFVLEVISLTTLLQARQEERAWDPWVYLNRQKKKSSEKKNGED